MDVAAILDWLEDHTGVLVAGTVLSVLAFIATVVLVPIIVARVPADYFASDRPAKLPYAMRHPALRWLWLVVKNVLGLVLLLAGLAMLALPGPGLVSLMLGLMLMSFPGKFRLQRWLVSRPPVLRAINAVRRRAGRPPLVLVVADPPPPSHEPR